MRPEQPGDGLAAGQAGGRTEQCAGVCCCPGRLYGGSSRLYGGSSRRCVGRLWGGCGEVMYEVMYEVVDEAVDEAVDEVCRSATPTISTDRPVSVPCLVSSLLCLASRLTRLPLLRLRSHLSELQTAHQDGYQGSQRHHLRACARRGAQERHQGVFRA